jgi:hypothetical protein
VAGPRLVVTKRNDCRRKLSGKLKDKLDPAPKYNDRWSNVAASKINGGIGARSRAKHEQGTHIVVPFRPVTAFLGTIASCFD